MGVSCCVRMLFSGLLGAKNNFEEKCLRGISLKHQNFDTRWGPAFYCYNFFTEMGSKMQNLKKIY